MSARLKDTIAASQEVFKQEPGKAFATVKTASSLHPTFRSEVEIRHHHLTIDEPPALGGDDAGPNPIEVVLAALGSCQEITYRAFATAMDIPLESVSVAVEGDIDFRGFFGVDDSIRAGFQNIRVDVNLVSDASTEKLEQLRSAVNAHCPVLDMLQNGVPTTTGMKQAEN